MQILNRSKDYLYHYTTFESAVKILASKKLLFSDFRRLNDINESFGPTVIYDKSFSVSEVTEFKKILNNYKQISFTMDKGTHKGFDIPAMWGHYAARGNGVCLVLDYDKINEHTKATKYLYAKEVEYSEPNFNDISYHKHHGVSFEDFIVSSKDDLFFHKTMDWEYEHEYRIIAISDEIKSLDISDFIVAVILFNHSHDNFVNSVEYALFSKINEQLGLYRYTSICGAGKLYDSKNSEVWPNLHYDLSQTRNAKDE